MAVEPEIVKDDEYIDIKDILMILMKKISFIIVFSISFTLLVFLWFSNKPVINTQSTSYTVIYDSYGFAEDAGYARSTFSAENISYIYRTLNSSDFKSFSAKYLNIDAEALETFVVARFPVAYERWDFSVNYSHTEESRDDAKQEIYELYTSNLNVLLSEFDKITYRTKGDILQKMYQSSSDEYIKRTLSNLITKNEFKIKILDKVPVIKMISSSNNLVSDVSRVYIVIFAALAGLLLSIALVLAYNVIGKLKFVKSN
ncbi:hypothetical protein F0225_03040 [Vibrio pectenicida]|uniref:Uncharacterized protein n=1 Tax=Vibrio pectenicida TaxID=62763 RepID=A0A7Y3ZWN2_9VIBR|nr:hypothetical protein [Vibrio pectenicida]NOH70317.1 hypothetical protein [Vibrio pectenicida]